MRFIEVLANARVEREIEAFESTLELSVMAGRKTSCMDESLNLRKETIAALKNAGLSDADIREGGGQASQNVWSYSKSITHFIIVRNASMDLLLSAMAAVEHLFTAAPQPYFSRLKKHYTFHNTIPVYAVSASPDDAIRDAIRRSRSTAELIAGESGVRLGNLIAVRECMTKQTHDAYQRSGFDISDASDVIAEFCADEMEPAAITTYGNLPPATGKAVRRFLVRYSIEDPES